MSPEASAPLSPAAALLILGVLGAVAFAWVKTRIKHHVDGEETLQVFPAEAAEVTSEPPTPTPEPMIAKGPLPPASVAHAPPVPAPEKPVSVPVSTPAPAPRPQVTVASVPSVTISSRPVPPASVPAVPVRVGVFEMAASVELCFGELRVAVRAGSNTEQRFQRYAKVLLDELRQAQGAGARTSPSADRERSL